MSLKRKAAWNLGDDAAEVSKASLEGGALTGLVAGLLMALTTALGSAAVGEAPGTVYRFLASAFLGSRAYEGLMPIALGLGVQLAYAMVFAALFAASGWWRLVGKSRVPAGDRAVVLGLVYATALWLTMSYLVLPALAPGLAVHAQSHPALWWASHAVYGIALALAPALRHRFAVKEREDAQESARKAS